MSYVIAAISNGGGAPEQAYRKMQNAGACPERPFAEMFKFEVPSLMVGTLDSLMNLSDELGKTDAIVESVVRKVERSAIELSGAGKSSADLTVGGVPSNRYIQQFAWDYAKYPNRRPLKELVGLIGGGVNAIDEELKQLSQSYADKMSALQEAQRRKGGNLMVADLNDALSQDIVKSIQTLDSEYLKTLFVAVPSSMVESFDRDIYKLGQDLVGYGGPDWSGDPRSLGEAVRFGHQVDRNRKKGSPVVPGSVKKVKEDNECALFVVTILRSQYEAGHYEGDEFQSGTKFDIEEKFCKVLRDRRYVVRPFNYDPSAASRSAMALEQLQVETDSMKSGLTRWCKTHYGEAFVAWMHIKVIRVFVESVLRYGLPVDFTAVLYKVGAGKDADLVDALDRELGDKKKDDDKEDEEEYHDFVMLRFEP